MEAQCQVSSITLNVSRTMSQPIWIMSGFEVLSNLSSNTRLKSDLKLQSPSVFHVLPGSNSRKPGKTKKNLLSHCKQSGCIHTTTFKWWINILQSLLCCAQGCWGPSPNNRILTCIIHPSLIHSSLTQTLSTQGTQLSQTKLQMRNPFKTSASPSLNLCGIWSHFVPSLITLTTLNNASLIHISPLAHASSPSVWLNVNEESKLNFIGNFYNVESFSFQVMEKPNTSCTHV